MVFSRERAETLYAILVSCCGAPRDDLDMFLHAVEDQSREYRFQGVLGFGGKIYFDHYPDKLLGLFHARIDCYAEHKTEERGKLIIQVNAVLAALTQIWEQDDLRRIDEKE